MKPAYKLSKKLTDPKVYAVGAAGFWLARQVHGSKRYGYVRKRKTA